MTLKIIENFKNPKKLQGLLKQRLTVKQDDNTPLHPADIKLMAKELSTKYIDTYKKNPKLIIRARTILGSMTIDEIEPSEYLTVKSFDKSIDELFDDYTDYLQGRVKDSTKFKEFYAVQYLFY
jgi:hypothetical protein